MFKVMITSTKCFVNVLKAVNVVGFFHKKDKQVCSCLLVSGFARK